MFRRLLTHMRVWSATKPKHMTDDGVRYVQRYAMNPEMSPILHSIAFPEDVEWFDADYEPQHPSYFLFATPTQFYVYTAELDIIWRAGEMLAEVYEGLRDGRWAGLRKVDDWKQEEKNPKILNMD
jgi:hypothetical protein